MEPRTLGIIGLPELAAVLRGAGVEVVAGREGTDARITAPISDQLHRGRRFPVILEAAPVDELLPWAERIAVLTDLWVVRHSADDPFHFDGAEGWLDLPLTIEELLAAVGVDRTGLGNVLGRELAIGGSVIPGVPSPSAKERPAEGGSVGPDIGDATGSEDGSATLGRSTCAHCGEAVYGVVSRHLWWHLPSRAASCRSGTTVATPAVGPTPPGPDDDAAVAEDDNPGVAEAPWRPGGVVVFCTAAKGGVGTTTFALALSAAASERDLEVVLVDANRGQGDVAHYLRLSGASVCSVHDAAVSGRVPTAIVESAELTEVRPQRLDPIGFSVVLAPVHDGQADPALVTARVYDDVVRHVATRSDLVVVDAQILGRVDSWDLVRRVIVPLLEESAWIVVGTDMSAAAVVNTRERLAALRAAGVPASRVLVVPNRVEAQDVDDVERLGEVFEGLGEVVGSVMHATAINGAMNAGNPPIDRANLRHVVDNVLLRVTGDTAFEPPPPRHGWRAWFRRHGTASD